jgi:acyl dehydratase
MTTTMTIAKTITETTTKADEIRSSSTDTGPLEHPHPRVITSLEDLRACVGTHLGVSDWLSVEQPAINKFAEVTRDAQWIHVDPSRAEEGPFGATVAHGLLTLSLCSSLLWEVAVVDGMGPAINYGLNKVRFPAPLLVGSRVRMHVSVSEVTDIARGVEVVYHLTYETQGQTKPPCVADLVFRYYA